MKAGTVERQAEIVRELKQRGLLAVAESVARRHRMNLMELVWNRGYVHARARRELWKALYEYMPSYSQIARLFHLDCSTIRKGVERRVGEDGECSVRRSRGPFPGEGWWSCNGSPQEPTERRQVVGSATASQTT
jgi:hypothetical protein